MLSLLAPEPAALPPPATLEDVRARLNGRPVWSPNPGSQALFVTSPFYQTIYEGTRGPGKTIALCMDFAQDIGKGYGPMWRGIIFRKSYPRLDDLIAKSKRFFTEVFPSADFNIATHTWKFKGGEELLFRFMGSEKDYWNYHGHEYPFIGFDELTEWPNSECWDLANSFNRWPADGVLHPGMQDRRRKRGTTNPYGIGHGWVKRRYVLPSPAGVPFVDETGEAALPTVRIHGHWSENARMLERSPEYIEGLKGDANESRRKAWVDGNWDILSGGLLSDFWDPAIHRIQPFDIPEGWPLERAIDWGSSHPYAVGWFVESDGTDLIFRDGSKRNFPAGSVFLWAEQYGWNGTANEGCKLPAVVVGKKILDQEEAMGVAGRVLDGPGDSKLFVEENGQSIARDFASVGVVWTEAMNTPGSRVVGAQKMQEMLHAAAQVPRERPGFYICSNCIHSLRTIPEIPRSEKNPDDADTNAEDHLYDMARYRLTRTRHVSHFGSHGLG